MGTVASSSRRRCAAAKPIPSREVEEFEEEKLGPAALELRGDRFMASGRRRRQGWSLAISHDFEAAAYSYILAEKWRKAALAFTEQAVYDLQFGDEHELSAASALLRSAKCYSQIEDQEEGDVAATKHALDKAIGLFVKKNNLRLAAMSCVELAEFYMEYQQLQSALDSFEQAAEYYGDNRRRSRHCRFRANLLRFTLANEDMLRVKGRLPIKDYRRRFARYIKSSDPDWRAQVRELFSSTIVAPPWM